MSKSSAYDKKDVKQSDVDNTSILEINLKVLESRRDAIFARLQIVYDRSVRAFENDISKDLFMGSTATLDNLRTEFNSIIDQLTETQLKIKPDAVINYQSHAAFEDLFCRCRFVESRLKPVNTSGTAPLPVYKRSIKLPELELATFSGDPIKWPIFYESFKRTIHENPDLADHDRVQYLIGKLSGRALSVCVGITPNGENYQTIWSSLVERYNDKRTLATAYLDRMFEIKPFITASSKNIESFLDAFSTAVSSLNSLKIDNLSDVIILYLALKKIDSETIRSFEMFKRGTAMPTYDDLIVFLREHSKILDRTATGVTNVPNKRVQPENTLKLNKHAYHAKATHSFVASSSCDHNNRFPITSLCPVCNNNWHPLYKCSVFHNLTIDKRSDLVKDHQGCSNCLSLTHNYSACKSSSKCRFCERKHHSLLCRKNAHYSNVCTNSLRHDANGATRAPLRRAAARGCSSDDSSPAQTAPALKSNSTDAVERPHVAFQSTSLAAQSDNNAHHTCLLGTAQVYIKGSLGNSHCIRALIDSGSQNNFITASCCKKFNINGTKVQRAVVKGIGSSPSPIRAVTSVTLQSRFDENVSVSIDAFVLDRITDELPTVEVDVSKLNYLNNLQLADASFSLPGDVDIIIGATLFSDILLSGRVRGPLGAPTALETVFGYIVIGNTPTLNSNTSSMSFCSTVEHNTDLILQKFWQLEEVSPCEPALSPADTECENIFINNFTRNSSGRYSVALPFCRDVTLLGDSYEYAKKRFMLLERKLSSNPELRLEYDAIIWEYLDKGYISPVINDNHTSGYYIPHHAVARPDKTTTKWRMVMDASAKSTSGVALNDILYTGQNLQNDLFIILINFRFYKTAFTSDVKQMYLRILTHDAHRIYQKFLYSFDPAKPLGVYQFNRVCFGLRSSPFLAMRVLRQLCADERNRFPLATEVVKNSCYMDDICYSLPTLSDGLQLRDSLRELCTAGGFELVKWSSNTLDLLDSLPETQRYDSRIDFNDPANTLKVLGLQWCPATDEFMFTVKLDNRPPTKRNILSVIARLYDVLGLIAPVILYAKLILQNLFTLKVDWDATPPSNVLCSWLSYLRELRSLENLRIPRHLEVFENSSISIVAFSDASERAYGCVVYVRCKK